MAPSDSRFAQLGRDSLVYGLGTMVQKVIGFLLLPVYTRIFSTADYGVIDVINAATLLMTLLLSSSMLGTALSYYFYNGSDEEDRKLTVSTDLLYLVLANVLIAGVGLVLIRDISHFLLHSQDYVPYLRLAILTLPFAVTNSLNANLFRLRFRPWHYFALTVSNVLLTMLMNIVLVAVLKVGLVGVYWTNLVTTALFATIGLWMNRHLLSWRISLDRLRGLLAYGVPLIPGSVAMWAIQSLDRWFLSRYAGLENVGLYATGVRIGSAVAVLTQAFRTANAPHQFATALEEYAKEFYADTLKYYSLALGFLGLGISIYSREVVELLTPEPYWRAYIIVPFAVFSAIAYGTTQLVGVGLLLTKRTVVTGTIISVAGLVHIGLLYALVPTFGYVGAGLATLVTDSCMVGVLYYASQKLYPIPYQVGKLGKIALVTMVWVIIGVLFNADRMVVRIMFKSALLVMYPAFLVIVGAASWAEFQRVLDVAAAVGPARWRRSVQRK